MKNPTLKSLVGSIRGKLSEIQKVADKIAEVQRQIAESAAIETDLTKSDLTDASVLAKISNARLKRELLPQQLTSLDASRAELIQSLKPLLDALQIEIIAARESDQTAVIGKIAKLLAPWCGDNPDAARHAAVGLPVVEAIGAASSWTSKHSSGADRSTNPKHYDAMPIEHATNLLAIIDRYAANNESFMPEEFPTPA